MGRKKRQVPTTDQTPNPWRWAALAGLLTFLLYLPSLGSGFVYDAEAQITTGEYIHDHSHFAEVMTFRVMSRDVLDNNRPVQLFSLMVDSLLWGKAAFGYHLTSNLLHSINTALVFLLIVMALGDAKGASAAFLGALLFGFHPVNVEPVAEVSSREDVLATFFILGSIFCAANFSRTGKWPALIGCALTSLLAVGAKETGAGAPAILAAYWLLFQREGNWRRWLAAVAASGVVASFFMAARFALQPHDSEIFLHPPVYLGGSLKATLGIQPTIWAFLISCILWPLHLSADYVQQNLAWIGLLPALLGLLIFVSLQALLAWKSRVAAFGALVFWLGLAPVSNLLPIYRPLADRYLYLPMVGIALMVAGGLALLGAKRRWSTAAQIVCAAVLIALAGLTWNREKVFANSVNLWADTKAKSPFSPTAANNYGYALLTAKDYPAALKGFEYSLNLTAGEKADSWAGAAIAFEELGQNYKAEEALHRAISINPIYGRPDKMLKSLMATRENAAVLEEILKRRPAQP